MRYSANVTGDRLDYALTDDTLEACVDDGLRLSVRISGGDVAIKRKRVFAPLFRVGVAGIVLPLFTFGVILAKEGRLDLRGLGPAGFIHVLFVVVGIILVARYRRPHVGIAVTKKKDGLVVWRDERMHDEFEAFVAAVISTREGVAKSVPTEP
jgi:hypothetical protein